MTIKYLKHVSTMLAIVSAIRDVDLDLINYATQNKYQHVYLKNWWRRGKSFAKDLILMGTLHQVLGVHSLPLTEVWLLNISIKKLKELLAHFAQAIWDIHTVITSTKTYIFTAWCEHFTTDQEINKVVDGFFHTKKVGNKHFEAYLLEKLVEDKKSFFQSFRKASLITGNE